MFAKVNRESGKMFGMANGDFAERLSDLMDDQGWTFRALASKAGVSATTISDWRSGGTEPKATNLWRAAGALGVSPEYLLGLSDDPEARPVSTPDYEDALEDAVRLVKHLQAWIAKVRGKEGAEYVKPDVLYVAERLKEVLGESDRGDEGSEGDRSVEEHRQDPGGES